MTLCILILLSFGWAAANEKLFKMAPDTWMEVPGTKMKDVCFPYLRIPLIGR